MDALILFAHGARDPRWAEPFRLLRDLVAAQTDMPVHLAFLELMAPSLEDVAQALHAQGIRNMLVCPAFMAQGGHLRQDLPRKIEALQTLLPDTRIVVTRPIGEAEPVMQAIAAWICGEAQTFRQPPDA